MEIDRDKIYQLGNYTFQNFTTLDADTIEKIRLWRNHPDIRKLMYDSSEISPEQHHSFISSLPNRKDKFYWLVFKDDQPVGVVSVVDVNFEKEEGQSGFYLIPDYLDKGLGFEFIMILNYFLYNDIKFKHLFGRAQSINKNVLFINYFLGFEVKSEEVIIDGVEYFEVDGYGEDFLSKYPSLSDLNNLINSPNKILQSLKEFNKKYKYIRSNGH